MNIGERLSSPRVGESAEAYTKRQESFREKCEELFSSPTGREILSELIRAHHPLQPRMARTLNTHESAFLDGELSMISFLALNSGQTDLFALPPERIVAPKQSNQNSNN